MTHSSSTSNEFLICVSPLAAGQPFLFWIVVSTSPTTRRTRVEITLLEKRDAKVVQDEQLRKLENEE
jgi:hypothetical protein